jgi:hypothetical protein
VSDLLERVWLLKQTPLFAAVETEDLQMDYIVQGN